MEMHSEVYEPPEGHPLRPYGLHIFRMRAGGLRRETVLPHVAAHVLFTLGEPIPYGGMRLGTDAVRLTDAFVGGVQTGSIWSRPQGNIELMGIGMPAEAAGALLGLPVHELTDQAVPGELVFPDAAEVAGRLREADGFARQVEILTGWLLRRVRPVAAAAMVRHACGLLRQPGGEDGPARVARALAVSPRHLRRLFAEHVGVSPATYVRLSRFRDAVRRATVPGHTLTRIAHDAGYHDQAHFCRDFRALAGMTAQEYRQSAAPHLAGHIFSASA